MLRREGNRLTKPNEGWWAKWDQGKLMIGQTEDPWTPEEAAQLAEFAANPPQLKYRITRTFDEIPNIVVAGNITKIVVGRRDDVCTSRVLAPPDIEEVWE